MRIELLHPWPVQLGFGRRLEGLVREVAARHQIAWRRRFRELPAALRAKPPDLVLVYTSLMAPLVLLLKLRRPSLGVRYMVRGDEYLEARARQRRLRAWTAVVLQGLLARLGARFVFVSWDLEELFLSRHPNLRDTRVLPNTLGRPLPPVRPFDGRVAVVGEFGGLKRIEWLLEELEESGCEAHVFGNATLPVRWKQPWVVSHGHVGDLVAELGMHCTLLAMASVSEGFPNVVIDAQASGCAIVLPETFPFARFPLAPTWRFPQEPGGLRRRLAELGRAPRDFTLENGKLRDLLESDWGRRIEEALL